MMTSSASDLHRLTPRGNTQMSLRVRKTLPHTICEDTEEERSKLRQTLVTTQFVEWSCRYYAQSVTRLRQESDLESRAYYQREWRYLRNVALRVEAKEEQRRILTGRLEHQVFNNRSPDSPSVVTFHPYEPHLVVAAKDCYGVWDWSSGSKLTYNSNHGGKGSRITSVQLVNVHDITLLLNGSDDGSVRLWSNYLNREGREPELVTAWQALPDIIPSNRSLTAVGMVMSWEQKTQQLLVTGDTSKIRIWDAEKELKMLDLHTGTEACVTSISSQQDSSLIAVGCGDGSVRLFDRRHPPHDARIMTWREHSAWVVGVHLKTRGTGENSLISGCVAGDVRFFDLRKSASYSTCQTFQGMTTMTVHNHAEIFCCGSVNQLISVYKTNGTSLNVIKYHEGFMGARIGPVSCLALHPLRVALAAGSVDCNLSVFAGEPKR